MALCSPVGQGQKNLLGSWGNSEKLRDPENPRTARRPGPFPPCQLKMGTAALLPTHSHGLNEIKAMTAFCNPQSINSLASGILEGPCPGFQRPSFPSFRFLPDLHSAGKPETRHGRWSPPCSPSCILWSSWLSFFRPLSPAYLLD